MGCYLYERWSRKTVLISWFRASANYLRVFRWSGTQRLAFDRLTEVRPLSHISNPFQKVRSATFDRLGSSVISPLHGVM
jgi:hypothetical protein